jgi:hypothetical protein
LFGSLVYHISHQRTCGLIKHAHPSVGWLLDCNNNSFSLIHSLHQNRCCSM